MKMIRFVAIVLLILCHKPTPTEGAPKLLPLVKEDKVYCMAEHSGSEKSPIPAIVLQTTNLSEIDLEAAVNLTVASVADGPNDDCIIMHWPDPCFAEDFFLRSSIKRNDTWEEVEWVSITRDQSVLWDNHLHHYWCSRLNDETYKFEINYTISTPCSGVRHYHAEVNASLHDTGPPDPPLELKAMNVSPNSVNLTWLLPLRPNGKLRYFGITVEPLYTCVRYPTELRIVHKTYYISSYYSREYNYLLEFLTPSTDYKISVWAHNTQAGEAATLKIRTPLAKPNIGPEFLKLQNSVRNSSVQIQLPSFDTNLTNDSAYFLIGTSDSNVIKKLENVDCKNELLKKIKFENETNYWFAAELNLLLDEPINFTVGDNSNSTGSLGSYWNRPFNPKTDFTIFLVAINQDEYHFEYEVKSLEFNINVTKTRNGDVPMARVTARIMTVIAVIFMFLICIAVAALISYLKRICCSNYKYEVTVQ